MASDSATPTPAPPGRVRRTLGWYRRGWWWKLPVTGLLVAVIVVPLGLLLFHLYLNHRLDTELDRIRAEGYPAHWSEIDAWIGPMPTPERDATPLYEAAIAALATHEEMEAVGLTQRPGIDWEMMDEPIPPEVWERARTLVEVDAEALRLVREANAMVAEGGAVRFPRDWSQHMGMLLPELGQLRRLVNNLENEAELAANREDAAAAVEAAEQIVVASRALEHDPNVISHLVRLLILAGATATMEDIIAQVQLTDDQLTALERCLDTAEESRSLRRALAGERALFVGAFELIDTLANSKGGVFSIGTLWRGSGVYKLDRLAYLRLMQWQMDAAGVPLAQRNAAAIQQNIDGLPRIYFMTRILTPAYDRVFAAQERHNATLDVARVGLALERHRLAHGNYPPTLDQLVPMYLDVVPVDPFTGKPLLYRVSDDGESAVVYSVGEDERDDGGRERLPDGKRYAAGTDITFSLGDAQRRFFHEHDSPADKPVSEP